MKLIFVSKAYLPTKFGNFEIHGFTDPENLEHIAITKGEFPSKNPPLTRIHSECFTGDILGSLKCDCGNQLQKALELIEKEKNGIVIYLRQEGRGIGLLNKIKAYKLQEEGLDTLEANLHLGFPADARNYDTASEILKYFGITQIKLLTNNPDKIAQLEKQGIEIVERIDISTEKNGHNERYINTKNEKFGHLFNNY
ncbi:MAG: GTP cyclohydrolase II [Candidatus Gracilibacteria bacterium]|jgi:GTP cyclohydrolase II|nr:GTP cyclohydrolase II [Candidatus Gracilibacteria bacterium]